jgi:(p)ppGpp synthase/HD superfamily hydrolase
MLIETIEELLILAKKYKYSNENIELIKSAYVIAAEYSTNRFRYRKKNRPFINHLVSTCSFLIYSNVNIETVVAGLLHSVKNDMKQIYNLNYQVGEIVDNYFDITTGIKENIKYDTINNIDWAVITIQLANSTDMIMAGEFAS